MNCPKCRTPAAAGAAHCKRCGSPLGGKAAAAQAPAASDEIDLMPLEESKAPAYSAYEPPPGLDLPGGPAPALKLGPAWWFHDSPEGMMRFREQTTETAGFYNTVGFNDDTRAFLSIPARHDVARRIDCAFLARLVSEHRLDEDEAAELAHDLTYRLVKQAYRL